MDRVRERIKFIKTFKSDKDVAAIVASSRFVVRDVIKHMPHGARNVIECGPGEGIMTRTLLKHLHSEGTLLAIESNKEFVDILNRMRDSRLRVVQGKAQDVIHHAKLHGISSADVILASIPFSFLTSSERTQFIYDAHTLLAPQGTLIIFHQYSPLMYGNIKKIFGRVRLLMEMRNLPPCFIMVARK